MVAALTSAPPASSPPPRLGKLLGAAGEEQREDIIDQMKRSYYEGEPEGRPLRDVRELEVPEARSLIKDLHKVLGDEASQTKLREARVKVQTGKLHHLYKQFDKDLIPTDQGPRVQMMHSLIPLVDRLAAGVFKKHRMPHGYVEAINACIHAVHDKQHVTRVSVADHQLRVDMERLSQVVLGEPAPHLVGRVPELDLLAERFLDAGPAERARALREAGAALAARRAEAEARQAEVPESTAEYVTVMKAVLSHGVKFVEDKVFELSLKSFQEGLDESELEALKARIGILTEFLREQDHHRSSLGCVPTVRNQQQVRTSCVTVTSIVKASGTASDQVVGSLAAG